MKITMYELFGLVKDGKAPKEIIYNGYNYLYHTDRKSYYRSVVGSNWIALTTDFSIFTILNDEVEILEEEKKIPEKIPEEIIVGKKQPTHRIKKIEKKINEIISYLDYLKNKGE